LSSTDTGSFRFRSMCTYMMSLTSRLNSTQEPRYGMIRAVKSFFPFGWIWSSKNTPGERWSWLTITRSAPLMMKVPLSVMIGSSPR